MTIEFSSAAPDQIAIKLRQRDFTVVPYIDKADFSEFWSLFSRGEWETETLDIIDLASGSNDIFLDVGSWIGPTALWAAFTFKKVVAFEPDPVALKALRANLALNGALSRRIEVLPVAVGGTDGDLEIYSSEQGLSDTSVFNVVQRGRQLRNFGMKSIVPMLDLARYIRDLHPNENRIFAKIDIEGAEFELLPHLHEVVSKYGVTVYVTLHPDNIVKSTGDTTNSARITKIGKCLEPFTDLNWFSFIQGRYARLGKVDFLRTVLNNINVNHTLGITNQDI